MSTFILKSKLFSKKEEQREFATAVMVGDEILNAGNHAANALSNRSQSYYDDMFKGLEGTSTKQIVKEGAKSRAGSFAANRTVGGAETYKGVNKVATGKQAYNMGQKSVGVVGGMKNTWSRMGTMGKVGTTAAVGLTAGLALKGLLSKDRKN